MDLLVEEVRPLLEALHQKLTSRGEFVATAESCTGGWIAATLTEFPGASAWFERGFVTYSNLAKKEMLGVPNSEIDRYGAVSVEVVAAMAQGAIKQSQSQWSIAVSGIAGPGGGSAEKPVGTVCFGWASADGRVCVKTQCFHGGRHDVRAASVIFALQGLLEMMD